MKLQAEMILCRMNTMSSLRIPIEVDTKDNDQLETIVAELYEEYPEWIPVGLTISQ